MTTSPTIATDPAREGSALVAAEVTPRWVQATWQDGRVSRWHHLWLGDNCPEERHPSTNHRVVESSAIPADVGVSDAAIAQGRLEVTWADGHTCRFAPDWLRRFDYSAGVRAETPEPRLWTAADLPDLPRATLPELMHDDHRRAEFQEGFLRYGVGLLAEVPCEPGTVAEVGALLGQVRTTSWGTIFDVQARTDANSLAFTGLALVPHTDEGYRDPTPTIQLQHFLQVDTEGGDATLVDGFAVAEELRSVDPRAFELLAATPLQFHFADDRAELSAEATTLGLDGRGRVRRVRFSNHSVLPFLLDWDDMEEFYAAYQAFGRLRMDPRFMIQVPMPAGTMYLVDNERVLHGRTELLSGGARHLQSCYIERDEFASTLRLTRRRLAAADPTPGSVQ